MSLCYFVYEPATGNHGEEIPAFTIYLDGEAIAFTNPRQSREEQHGVAMLFLAAHLLLVQSAEQDTG
ncbi:hypothetical protein [Arvimicrobium flavum]|uniref:hypothetical protein n=1 Tax=Arvimicrobium flavum TaxID=3393320 RepID=UPI00237A3520|nr:hypothetical protein [Mesorhizobium shangrilense]